MMEGNRGPHISHWDIAEEIAEYIYRNLDHRVGIEEIADRCRFSPFYLNRLFRSVVGESICEFEKRLRLGRAASRLLKESETNITTIAADSGYSPSNFAMVFKETFGRSPAAWRQAPEYGPGAPTADEYANTFSRIARLRADDRGRDRLGSHIRVEHVDPMTLYHRRYRGPIADPENQWKQFRGECFSVIAADEAKYGSLGHPRRWIGVSCEDTAMTKADRFTYDLCVEVSTGFGRKFVRISGGSYARYDWAGSISDLSSIYDDLFGVAMPARNLRMAQRGLCLEVHNEKDDSDFCDLSIYVPLELDEEE